MLEAPSYLYDGRLSFLMKTFLLVSLFNLFIRISLTETKHGKKIKKTN